jgi:hypothetical protein
VFSGQADLPLAGRFRHDGQRSLLLAGDFGNDAQRAGVVGGGQAGTPGLMMPAFSRAISGKVWPSHC